MALIDSTAIPPGDTGYNVYSIDQGRWLHKKNLHEKKLFNSVSTKFDSDGARALLFDQIMLVVSRLSKLYFFNLINIKKPKLMGIYDIS